MSLLGQYCLALFNSPQKEAYKHLFKGLLSFLGLEEGPIGLFPMGSLSRPISPWFRGHFRWYLHLQKAGDVIYILVMSQVQLKWDRNVL